MRTALLRHAGLFALGLSPLLTGCHGCSRGLLAPSLDVAAVGPLGSVDDVDFAPYLAVARATVTHAARPDVHPPAHTGQRVFVTFWSPGRDPVRATGLGPTLLDSVTRASEEIAKSAAGDGRIEIDVLTGAEPIGLGDELRESVFKAGTTGYLASDAKGHVGFALPSEVVTERLVTYDDAPHQTAKIDATHVRAHLATRAGVGDDALDAMSAARFTAAERIEGAVPGEAPLALYRSLPPRPTQVTADPLFAAARAADDYLAAAVGPDGAFRYSIDSASDTPTSDPYATLRHVGATYALLEGYEEMHVIDWVTAADRALAYALPRAQRTPDGSYLAENADLELEKVGGAGLLLITLAEYQRATGDAKYLEQAKSFASYIVHAQYPDGHLRDNDDVRHEAENPHKKKRRREVFFYFGEAVLGLMRLHALDPRPEWLNAARKAADWVIDVRDAHLDLAHQPRDAWMTYAFRELYAATGDERYVEHALTIARAMELDVMKPPLPGPDYDGACDDTGDATMAGVELEALTNAVALLRRTNKDDSELKSVSTRVAAFMLGSQMGAESAYLAKNPEHARGCLRENVFSGACRIDIQQHAASAWLRLAHELRDPSWGKP